MNRADFSEAELRQMAWNRRRVCRAIGAGFDALIDEGVDPTETMDKALLVVLSDVRTAQAEPTMVRREAA